MLADFALFLKRAAFWRGRKPQGTADFAENRAKRSISQKPVCQQDTNQKNPRVRKIFVRNSGAWNSAAEKRGLWEGVVQELLRRALFSCFSVFWGDFLLQISQKFLSEIAPPMQAFLENPLAKNPKTQLLRNGGCVNFMDAWKNASVLQEKPCP